MPQNTIDPYELEHIQRLTCQINESLAARESFAQFLSAKYKIQQGETFNIVTGIITRLPVSTPKKQESTPAD